MQIEHLNKETTDGTVRNLDALYQLFPSCFTEAQDAITGKMRRVVDWSKLRELLGEYVEDGEPEKYDFTWVGKRAAQREAAAPCRKTLRPCPEESVDWDTTQNLYIEGDNLEVLKLLQNSYMGKVKMIYIDPPYNTGNDFVYHDDFHRTQREEDEAAGVINENGERLVKNTEANGKFHSDWCSMVYARLMVARSLLTEDGVIFISIDDHEVGNLKKICNEVFGEKQYITTFVWEKGKEGGNDSSIMRSHYESILLFCKNCACPNIINLDKKDTSRHITHDKEENLVAGIESLPNEGELFQLINLSKQKDYQVKIPLLDGSVIEWPSYAPQTSIDNWIKIGKVFVGKKRVPYIKSYLKDELNGQKPSNIINQEFGTTKAGSIEMREFFGSREVFSYPKPSILIKRLCSIGSSDKAVIIDFFSGSASTAHAVMQLNAEDGGNRKFIMVQLPEETAEDSEAYKAGYKNICEIGKERIRRAGKKIKADSPLTTQDLDIGFRVLKCDESNYKPVAFAPKDYTQESLDMFLDNIKEERTGLDLLFDCMMRWGLELSLPYDTQKVEGCTIYNVDDGNLVACFDGVVTSAVIDAIAETHPLRVVFRDSSFTEAAQKMNLFELFKQKCGWTDQEVQNNVRVI